MSDESWDEQFRQFLRKTGDDFRRAGEEVKAEAQRLLDAAMDLEKQQRVRDRLNELSQWAQRTAQGVAGAVGDAVNRAENVFHRESETTPEPMAEQSPRPARPRKSSARKAAGAKKKASRAKSKGGKKARSAGKRKR
jgi:hypothetical protein